MSMRLNNIFKKFPRAILIEGLKRIFGVTACQVRRKKLSDDLLHCFLKTKSRKKVG